MHMSSVFLLAALTHRTGDLRQVEVINLFAVQNRLQLSQHWLGKLMDILHNRAAQHFETGMYL